jgi:hypothetical protein
MFLTLRKETQDLKKMCDPIDGRLCLVRQSTPGLATIRTLTLTQ